MEHPEKIFRLHIKCAYIYWNFRTILVSEDDTFEDLHFYIQKLFWFDNSHPRTYFVRKQRKTLIEISYSDYSEYPEYTPHELTLKEVFTTMWFKKIKYLYDFWDERRFEISLQRIRKFDKSIQLPQLILSEGWMFSDDMWGFSWVWQYIEQCENKEFDDRKFDSFEEFKQVMTPILNELDIKTFKF